LYSDETAGSRGPPKSPLRPARTLRQGQFAAPTGPFGERETAGRSGYPSGFGRVLMAITVVKRNGQREPYDANKINLAIEKASAGLDENITWVTQIASELELTLFDGITTQQLDEAVIQVALQNVKDDPAFDTVAARLLLKTIYKRVLGDYETEDELARLHTEHFEPNIRRGVEEGLLDTRLVEMFDLPRLASSLTHERDDLLKYI